MSTTTTEPMPTGHEAALLTGGQLVPALLQAVRDERIAERDAHLAFSLAVPVVAARLGLSARAILIVTDNGTAAYGPNGLTIAEECEGEVLLDADNSEQHSRRVTTYGGDLFRWRCSCGLTDDDYLTRDYAIDGWREAHGLEPVTNYPQV